MRSACSPEHGETPLTRHRAERQVELYVDMLRILERDLGRQHAEHYSDAEQGTRRRLETMRRLARQLCDEFGLEPPSELGDEEA